MQMCYTKEAAKFYRTPLKIIFLNKNIWVFIRVFSIMSHTHYDNLNFSSFLRGIESPNFYGPIIDHPFPYSPPCDHWLWPQALPKKAVPAFAFQDLCVQALPGSLSFEMMKSRIGLMSSLAPLFPTPCDHLSEHMLTPNGATRTQLLRFLLQGTLVSSIPETWKPGIIQIYGPDR
jgi:hypothetical protein